MQASTTNDAQTVADTEAMVVDPQPTGQTAGDIAVAMDIDSDVGIGSIKDNLEDALNGDVDFKGDFSFKKSYEDAPNPTLSLSGLGLVGLPLSTRDADAIKAQCIQAPFGKGDRTLVDKTVRDTWEMDGALVEFRNPDWDKFMGGVSAEVCSALGVSISSSKPRYELYKLLLYETGSHFLPHVDTEKTDGMFATIVVVLPSRFTGGALHLSHGDLSATYDCSEGSHLQTTVMAWYTDVMHEIKPIESGYRLALAYNLVHTTQSLRPAVSTATGAMTKLGQILRLWANKEGKGAPGCIYYLLDHRYSQANLSASALKGADAHKVGLLDTLAKTHGFGLGLAHICCYQRGPADDTGPRRGRYYDDSDTEENEGPFSFELVNDQETSIENFVDLDGSLISEKRKFSDAQTIPDDLEDVILEGEDYEEEYEGYQGNSAGDLERWYRRTVLVIWPNWNSFAMLYTHGSLSKACEDLNKRPDAVPREQDVRLAKQILSLDSGDGSTLAIETVCDAACKWGDAILWCQAVMTGCQKRGVLVLPREKLYYGISVLRFGSVYVSLEAMLEHEKSNKARLDFLDEMVNWASDLLKMSGSDLADTIRPWVASQVEKALKNLRPPNMEEYTVLMKKISELGGIMYLKDTIAPQLANLGDSEFLCQFASRLYSDETLPPSDERDAIILALLSSAIAKAVVFISTKSYYNRTGGNDPRSKPLAEITRIAQCCIDFRVFSLLAPLIDRVLDPELLRGQSAYDVEAFHWEVLMPFVVRLSKSDSRNIPSAHLLKLQSAVVTPFFHRYETNSTRLTKEKLAMLLDAVGTGTAAEPFISSVLPRLRAMNDPRDLQVIIEELYARKEMLAMSIGETGTGPDPILHSLLNRYVAALPLSPQAIIGCLNWLADLGHVDGCTTVLHRITNTAFSPEYVKTVLIPLLPMLRKWGATRSMQDILPRTYQEIVSAWLDIALGPLPTISAALGAELANLNQAMQCQCPECPRVREFLTRPPVIQEGLPDLGRLYLASIGAPRRRHVEAQLNLYAPTAASYSTVRSSPQGLEVMKCEPLRRLLQWQAEQKKGQQILNSISTNQNELMRLLGPVYNRTLAAIPITNGPQPVPPPDSPPATASYNIPTVWRVSVAAPAEPAEPVASSSTANTADNPNPPPAAVAGQDSDDDVVILSSTTSARPRISSRKRKMLPYNDSEVIDLT